MADPKQQTAVSALLDRHRRELADRTDISQAMRKLSQSSGRNPLGPAKQKPRSLGLTLLIAIPAVLAMVVCVATASLVLAGNLWLQSQLTDPGTTVQKYYAAVGEQNYTLAYTFFTDHYKASVSLESFQSKGLGYDQDDGLVKSYSVTSTTTGNSAATYIVTIVRSVPNTLQTQTIQLKKVGSDWLIDDITRPTLAPLATPSAT